MSKITDIWKEKYGISNFEKTINITSKDNIYKIFKKTAKFIYKNGMANGDFDEKTELEAIQHLKDNFFDQKDATITQIDKSKLTDVEKKNLKAAYKFDDTTFGKCHFYQMDYRNGYDADQSKLLIVDPSNTTSIKDKVNLRWKYYDEGFQVTSGGFTKLNQDLLIGYDKLHTDIARNMPVDAPEIKELLSCLEDPQGGKKANQYHYTKDIFAQLDKNIVHTPTMEDFKKDEGLQVNFGSLSNDPKEIEKRMSNFVVGSKGPNGWLRLWHKDTFRNNIKRNDAIDKVNIYLNKTYNLVLQQDYEEKLLKSRATFYQTKKNINKDAEATMSTLSNEWQNNLSSVEIDNEVDLNKLSELKPEISKSLAILPKADNGKKPILRFRKLRNHHALGMFTPFNNTLAVDFRPNDGGGIGLQSFVHEYGHFLDYNTKDELPRSLSSDFADVLNKTQAEINNIDIKKAHENKAYLNTPSEIFARGFELYASKMGLNNSLIKGSKSYENSIRYTTFTPEIRKRMFKYFDKEFPDLKRNIELSKNQQNKKIEESVDQLPEREIRRQAFLIEKGRLHTQNDRKILAKKGRLAHKYGLER